MLILSIYLSIIIHEFELLRVEGDAVRAIKLCTYIHSTHKTQDSGRDRAPSETATKDYGIVAAGKMNIYALVHIFTYPAEDGVEINFSQSLASLETKALHYIAPHTEA